MKKALLTVCVCLLSFAVRADESARDPLDNWPHWRGPEINGTAPRGDPPIRWDEQTNLKWKTAIPGHGSATPIVWGDQVFVLTAIDTGRTAEPSALPKVDARFEKKTQPPNTYYQFVVQSLDRRTGKLRWQRVAAEEVPHEGHHPTHNYAAGSPTTDGRYLYVSFGSRGIYCYDLDGKPIWRCHLGRLATRLGWGEAVTPVIYGDTLIVNWDQEAGSFLVALNARDGTTRWRKERDEVTTWATPLVVEHAGRTQVIVPATNRVRSYDLATGEVLWQCGGQTVNVIPSPIRRDGFVVCMSGYKGFAALALPLEASGDITDSNKILWKHDKGTPYVPSPLLYGDRLYFTQMNNALLTCLDVKTGKSIYDRVRLPGLGSLYASPVAAAGRIYISDLDGTTLVLKAGDKLEVLATNRLPEPIKASPVVVGKQLILRGDKYLYCLEEK